tara:strand:+ start:421 stop:636 length:216 start_codon:yes stop_codon:yes gene_type:complete
MSQIDNNDRTTLPERTFRLDKQHAQIGGVCAGIASTFGWDVTMVRLAWALSTIFLAGSLLLVYLVIWAVAD